MKLRAISSLGLGGAGLAALLMATPASAQPIGGPGWDGARPGNVIGTDSSLPTSGMASNIDPADTRTAIAPRLPDPAIGQRGTPRAYLRIAERDLHGNRLGAAQQALEMAETRLLDRSVPASQGNMADQSAVIGTVDQALHSLARRDLPAAERQTRDAMLVAGGGRMAAE